MTFKRILTPPEERTHDRLRASAARNGAEVFAKIRVADILPIEGSGISSELFRYALQSHFDFVIGDSDRQPLFAVEFDGPSHRGAEQVERDRKKEQLCDRFKLPLLRITSAYLDRTYRRLDLLTWFVECWFAITAIEQAQREGAIPDDEYADPAGFASIPGLEGHFPLWLSAEPSMAMLRLVKQGKCRQSSPSYFIGCDAHNVYRGIAWLEVGEAKGVIVTTAMRQQRFPLPEADALHEILIFHAHDALLDVIRRKTEPLPMEEIQARVASFIAPLTLWASGSSTPA